jgi:hypothetical protein
MIALPSIAGSARTRAEGHQASGGKTKSQVHSSPPRTLLQVQVHVTLRMPRPVVGSSRNRRLVHEPPEVAAAPGVGCVAARP